jgi:hypothetical protein
MNEMSRVPEVIPEEHLVTSLATPADFDHFHSNIQRALYLLPEQHSVLYLHPE